MRKLSLKFAKLKAWNAFSKYIRLKYARSDGMVRCITCNKLFHWKKIQAGHYISRKYLSTLFEERNVHPQCGGCNLWGKGMTDQYAIYLLNFYGDNILEILNKIKNSFTKYTINNYIEIEQEYLVKGERYAKEKGL